MDSVPYDSWQLLRVPLCSLKKVFGCVWWFAPCTEGLRLGAPLAQTGWVMGTRNPPVDVSSADGACPYPCARMHAQVLWIPQP